MCLGVLIDSVQGTISIPEDKLQQVNKSVQEWLGKKSILRLLLYVHKCVKPTCIFVNRMLELLGASHNTQKIVLTPDLKRNLRWFAKFLPFYNGVSLYDHKNVYQTLELDACLTGLRGRLDNCVYHLPLQRGYNGCTIAHLEMVNILVALRLFASRWTQHKVRVRCDNQAVVQVLSSGRTKDPFLAVCTCKIWFWAARFDVDIRYNHIQGVNNRVADLLSRLFGLPRDWDVLCLYLPEP